MKIESALKVYEMNSQSFVIRYFQNHFGDERKRKPFIVGFIVFVVILIGLITYQQGSREQGDMIISSAANESASSEIANQGDGGNVNAAQNSNTIDSSLAGAEEGGVSGGGEGGLSSNGSGEVGASGTGSDNTDGQNNGLTSATSYIFVDVGGAVNTTGLFALPAGSRVDDAIKAAGGLREDSETKYINRATVLEDGDRLYIPTENEIKNGTAPPTAGQVTSSGGYSGASASGSTSSGMTSGSSGSSNAGNVNSQGQNLININTGDSEELQKLNGVGPATAQKIIDYRTKNGSFKRIEEIMNVSGIGAKTFEKFRDKITV